MQLGRRPPSTPGAPRRTRPQRPLHTAHLHHPATAACLGPAASPQSMPPVPAPCGCFPPAPAPLPASQSLMLFEYTFRKYLFFRMLSFRVLIQWDAAPVHRTWVRWSQGPPGPAQQRASERAQQLTAWPAGLYGALSCGTSPCGPAPRP